MEAQHPKSSALLERAKKLMPGGVNSPVRAFRSVGGKPIFIAEAKGAYLIDVDGDRYVDLVGTWGPAILGHAREEVVESICQAAALGTSFGAPTEAEVTMAISEFRCMRTAMLVINSNCFQSLTDALFVITQAIEYFR